MNVEGNAAKRQAGHSLRVWAFSCPLCLAAGCPMLLLLSVPYKFFNTYHWILQTPHPDIRKTMFSRAGSCHAHSKVYYLPVCLALFQGPVWLWQASKIGNSGSHGQPYMHGKAQNCWARFKACRQTYDC